MSRQPLLLQTWTELDHFEHSVETILRGHSLPFQLLRCPSGRQHRLYSQVLLIRDYVISTVDEISNSEATDLFHGPMQDAQHVNPRDNKLLNMAVFMLRCRDRSTSIQPHAIQETLLNIMLYQPLLRAAIHHTIINAITIIE